MQQENHRLVTITTSYIELDKLLKRENMVASGGEARFLISQGTALVNGSKEIRKRRKLYPGDTVDFDGVTLHITISSSCSAQKGLVEQED